MLYPQAMVGYRDLCSTERFEIFDFVDSSQAEDFREFLAAIEVEEGDVLGGRRTPCMQRICHCMIHQPKHSSSWSCQNFHPAAGSLDIDIDIDIDDAGQSSCSPLASTAST